MKILIDDFLGETLDLALKMKQSGHRVRWHIRRKNDEDIGDGMVEKAADPAKNYDWADLIILGDVGYGALYERLKKTYPQKAILGGSRIADQLENDRAFGCRIMDTLGIAIPSYQEFKSFDEGSKYIKDNNKRYVFKPFGQLPRTLTYVSKGPEDMLRMMEYFKKEWPHGKAVHFILQEFIDGIEIAVGAWFNGRNFIKPYMPNFEHKKMTNGDLGPNTGEMGCIIRYVDKSRLFEQVMAKMEAFLSMIEFTGYFDLNCIVTRKQAYVLEPTVRFGFPTICIQDEVMNEDWASFLRDLALGTAEGVNVQRDWCTGVSICCPPWPEESRAYNGMPVMFRKENLLHWSDVKIINKEYCTAGNCGFIAIVCGTGPTVEASTLNAYKRIEASGIHIPNMFYRTDIGDRVIKSLKNLKEWGWL